MAQQSRPAAPSPGAVPLTAIGNRPSVSPRGKVSCPDVASGSPAYNIKPTPLAPVSPPAQAIDGPAWKGGS